MIVIVGGKVSPAKSPAQQKLYFDLFLISAALAILFIGLPIGFLAIMYKVEFYDKTQRYAKLTCQQSSPENVGSVLTLLKRSLPSYI